MTQKASDKIACGLPEAIEHARGQRIAAEAYQVIGNIADAAGLFEHPDVQRALDYFSGDDLDGSILPFAVQPGARP